MANLKIKFNNKTYSIDPASLCRRTARLEAHLVGMMEERLEGDGAEYYTLAPTALSFRSTAPLNELQSVQINGVTVDPSNYTLEEGSTIVTFPIDYLKTLNVGSYEVAVASESKTVKGGFTVAAPELNEHGFYYNQPYTAYVAPYQSDWCFFFRENGILDYMQLDNGYTEVCSYEVDGNNIMTHSSLGDIPATVISADEVYCAAIGTTFQLGDTSIVADEDYIYIYKEELGGYEVQCIDKTKAEYGAIKTGINDIDTTSMNGTYRDCQNLKKVMIPNTIIYTDDSFYFCFALEEITFQEGSQVTCLFLGGCHKLTSIILPDSIREFNFGDCSSLESINIPDGVEGIASSAFYGCSSLKSISLPNSVTFIGNSAFLHCSSLVDITIPNSVERIEADAFRDCSSLTSITIPDSVSFIGQTAYQDCTSLTNVIFNGTVAQWDAINKHGLWNLNVPATHVHCTDGDVAL